MAGNETFSLTKPGLLACLPPCPRATWQKSSSRDNHDRCTLPSLRPPPSSVILVPPTVFFSPAFPCSPWPTNALLPRLVTQFPIVDGRAIYISREHPPPALRGVRAPRIHRGVFFPLAFSSASLFLPSQWREGEPGDAREPCSWIRTGKREVLSTPCPIMSRGE